MKAYGLKHREVRVCEAKPTKRIKRYSRWMKKAARRVEIDPLDEYEMEVLTAQFGYFENRRIETERYITVCLASKESGPDCDQWFEIPFSEAAHF